MGLDLKYTGDSNHEIACPNCGGMHLHHSLVTTFWRAKEDAEYGLRVESGDASVKTSTEMNGNPSSRRDGVVIEFWCETCHASPRLLLAQHKGSTELNWLTPIELSLEKT